MNYAIHYSKDKKLYGWDKMVTNPIRMLEISTSNPSVWHLPQTQFSQSQTLSYVSSNVFENPESWRSYTIRIYGYHIIEYEDFKQLFPDEVVLKLKQIDFRSLKIKNQISSYYKTIMLGVLVLLKYEFWSGGVWNNIVEARKGVGD